MMRKQKTGQLSSIFDCLKVKTSVTPAAIVEMATVILAPDTIDTVPEPLRCR